MSSLARAVIETAYNMGLNPETFNRSKTKQFWRIGAGKADPAMNLLLSSQASKFFSGVPEIASVMPDAMRFSIDQDVADAVAKMDKTPVETLLKALPFAKLPYSQTWIEFSLPDGGLKVGWLIEEAEEGLSVRYVQSLHTSNHTPMYNEKVNRFLITEEGFHLYSREVEEKIENKIPGLQEEIDATKKYTCGAALSLLLLLNSRSNILQIGDPKDDFTQLNKKRRKGGLPELPTLNTISFDVARVLKKNSDLSPTEAAKLMAAALVRGHFKLRKTGVFFWSPYVRGAETGEEKEAALQAGLARDRDVLKSGDATLPHALFVKR